MTPAATAPHPVATTDGLASAAVRLVARYGDHVDAVEIRCLLEERHARLLAQASVTAYLAVLAERAVAAELARRVADARGGRRREHPASRSCSSALPGA